MNWTVLVAGPAKKQIARFPAKDRERITAALQQFSGDPFYGDVRKLEGKENRWRRRVGDYRIFFAIDRQCNTVTVSAVTRRTSTTY